MKNTISEYKTKTNEAEKIEEIRTNITLRKNILKLIIELIKYRI